MNVRTSWGIDVDGERGAGSERDDPLDALLDARFDEHGRLTRAPKAGATRPRPASDASPAWASAQALERAVADLARRVEEATAGRAPPAGREPEAFASGRGRTEPPAGARSATLDMLQRLEGRLDAMGAHADRRRTPERRQDSAAAIQTDLVNRLHGLEARLDDLIAQANQPAALKEDLARLAERIEGIAAGGRSQSGSLAEIRAAIGALEARLDADRPPVPTLREMKDLLETMAERLSFAEITPAALKAVERGYSQVLDRIASVEHLAQAQVPPKGLWAGLEALARQVDDLPSRDALSAIEVRLAEIAERIAAASVAAPHEAGFQRMEARLSELARVLSELRDRQTADLARQLGDILSRLEARDEEERFDASVMEARLAETSARIEEGQVATGRAMLAALDERTEALRRAIGEREAAPDVDLLPLERRLDGIARMLAAMRERDTAPDLRPLAHKLDTLGEALARHDADTSLRPLERRLDELRERFDRLASATGLGSADMTPLVERLGSIEARLSASSPDSERLTPLMERLEAMLVGPALDDRFAGVEGRIDALNTMLSGAVGQACWEDMAELRDDIGALRRELRTLPLGRSGATDLAPLLQDVAARLDRLPGEMPASLQNLENHLGRLAAMMEDTLTGRGWLGSVEARLDAIQDRLEAGGSFAAPGGDGTRDLAGAEAIADLARALGEDLGALQGAAAAAERRMREQLEVLHETLEAIVKRMAFLERDARPSRRDAAPEEPARNAALESPQGPRPAPAANAAGPEEAARPPAAQGLLGRLTSSQLLKRATGGRAESFTPPEDDEDGPETLLEPGTDQPMRSSLDDAPSSDTAHFSGGQARRSRRARSGHAAALGHAAEASAREAGGSDFLAAARRAAQAAAEEAAEAERAAAEVEDGGPLSRALASLKARRRMALAGGLAMAVAIALLVTRGQIGLGDASASRPPVTRIGTDAAPAGGRAAAPATSEAVEAPVTTQTGAADADIAFGKPDADPQRFEARPDAAPGGPVEPSAQAETSVAPADDAASADGAADAAGAAQDAASAAPTPDMAGEAPAGTASLAMAAMPPATIGPDALREAAASGDPAAQFEIASRYAEGRGVAKDLGLAVTWYERAVVSGLAPAQYRLGSLYEKGLGTERDPRKAVEWYRRAAEAGNAKAMHNLAVLLAEGAAGEPDLAGAARWFREAAEHGVRDSQFNLAVLHARGLGVTQDLIEAYKWFAVAGRSGDEQSNQRRDTIAASLPPSDLEKARAAAEAFEPLPLDAQANVVDEPEGGWSGPRPASVSSDAGMVQKAQLLLAARGFDAGPPDGRPGRKTRQAIARFQAQAGLPVTGEIDAGLIAALEGQAI